MRGNRCDRRGGFGHGPLPPVVYRDHCIIKLWYHEVTNTQEHMSSVFPSESV